MHNFEEMKLNEKRKKKSNAGLSSCVKSVHL